MRDVRGKKVAILGLGIDTKDITPWLKAHGALLTILDEKKGDKFSHLDRFDLIIRSPGVYRFRKEITAAQKSGVEISSKTKLFFDLCPAKIIGVTGTKGKGTTATLIYEILKAAGKKVFLGGNIGAGLFDKLNKIDKFSWVVLELSSFQLIDLEKSPYIAVVLMTTSEHLDWHPTVAEYVKAKKNIVSHQTENDFAVVNSDYPNSVKIGKAAKGRVTWVSKRALKNLRDDEIGLRGGHNRENIAAAAAVGHILGIEDRVIREVVKKFKGLEHRLEEVLTVGGVTFYNDSFSTTPETAIAAIKAFSEPEILILGGSSKNSDFQELGKTISAAKNVKTVMLIGLEGPRIGKYVSSDVPRLPTGRNMAEIVKIAYNNATSGDVVLLSPACASFDMFKSYKDRGLQFKQAVRSLRSSATRVRG